MPSGWRADPLQERRSVLETYRLKNIAILILLLLNAFLLMLLGYQYLQSRQTASDTVEQLHTLFADSQLTLSDSVDPLEPVLSPMILSRNTSSEAPIASALLGGNPVSTSQGGGIYSYTSSAGTIQFRSGGSFDGSQLSLPVDDISDFALSFCDDFGYGDVHMRITGNSGTVTGTQYVADVPIRDCSVTLTFQNGCLTAVSGLHISLENAALSSDEQLTCATALVRFLDYRSTAGIICSKVTSVQCLYSLRSTSSTLRLIPVWQVETDTYTYLVDASSGEISRL